MRKVLKYLFITIGAFILLIIALAVVVLPKMAFPWLSHVVRERSGYQLAAESVGFHLWKGISFKKLSIWDPQQKQVFAADQFYIDPHWPDLLQKRLSIQTISMDMAGGHVEGRGKMNFADGVEYHLRLRTDRFKVIRSSQTKGYVTADVRVAGHLKEPRAVDAKGRVEFRERRFQRVPTGVVQVDLEKGQGKIRGFLTVPLQASVTAQIDLIQEKIEAQFRTGSYVWNPKQPQLWDVARAEGEIRGTRAGALVQTYALFSSSAAVRYKGRVAQNAAGTRIHWDSLEFHPPKGADWLSEKPGYLLITPEKVLRLPELAMTDKISHLRLSEVQHSPSFTQAHLRADVVLNSLVSVVPELKMEKESRLTADIRAEGRFPEVVLNGKATSQIPHLEYEPAGIKLQDLNAELAGVDNVLTVKTFTGKLGKGTFLLLGKAWPEMDLKLATRKITFGDPKQLDLTTYANLELTGNAQAPVLTGSIRPREGTYNADTKKKKKEEDQPQREPPAIWKALRMDLHTEWSHGVWYRDGLTKIETSADLRVRKDAGSNDVTITGPISLLRGSYDAYGRDFKIETGDIVFTGGPEINPRLNIEAQYRVPDYDVRLLVLGTAKKPELNFTSSPPLSQQEILSLLVTGRPSGTFGTGGSDTGELAADVASTYLTKTLRSSGLNLGLDVVRVTPTPTGTIWTVGRYLGPDLFVSYGQNPKDSASSVVNAEYYLNRRWSISTQASSANDNYVDFLFRYPLKKKSRQK